MEPRESFVFYRSFYEAAALLKPKDRAEFVLAVCDYGLNGIQREMTPTVRALFLIAKANLDANQRRYLKGVEGGRQKKPSVSKEAAGEKPNDTDTDTGTVTETKTETEKETEKNTLLLKKTETEKERTARLEAAKRAGIEALSRPRRPGL